MNIALDFDNTYTEDTELWDIFIKSAQKRGHVVYCVTMRAGIFADMDRLIDLIGRDRVIICGKDKYGAEPVKFKREVCMDRNIKIDVWIDDMPEMISGGTAI